MTECVTEERPKASLDERLERFLTRERDLRFQLWQLLAAALFGVAAMVLFASLAVKGAEKNKGVAGVAHSIANGPLIARTLIHDVIVRHNPRLAKEGRFEGEQGLWVAPGGAADGTMLLLSRYDGDSRRAVVELIDLAKQETLHVWRPDASAIHDRSKLPEKVAHLKRDFNARRYMAYHPLPENDGSLIFHGMDSPLAKIDACGAIVWTVDGIFHHSIERDADGAFWTAENLIPPTIKQLGEEYEDDAIVRISPAGDVLFRKSVSQILIDAGMGHIVYSHNEYDEDPVHLNDVQPALTDGVRWKKGDLFLSLRNPSMIALYRPSTDEILWSKQGPWSMQHDVDILSDHEIGVFNNNAMAAPGGIRVRGDNNYLIYNFDTGAVRAPYSVAFKNEGVRTGTNGLAVTLPDGVLMAEGQNFGRIVAFDAAGATHWRYVNRASDGRLFQLGWSRALTAEESAPLKAALAEADCSKAGPDAAM